MFFHLIILSMATLIWGYGFVAVRLTLTDLDPYWSNALRFVLAGSFGIPFLLYKKSFMNKFKLWKQGFVGGVLLSGMLTCQSLGIKYTTLAKSGFIMALYALFVPFILMIFYKKKFRMAFWALICLALLGTGLLCNLEIANLNWGDILILICAIFAALHIVYIGEIAHSLDSPIEFNFIQNIFIGVIGVIVAYFFKGPINIAPLFNIYSDAFKGLIFLSFFSSMVAFTIQVVAQKKIPAHIAGLIYLLESPLAAYFGFIYFNEKLSFMNLIGAFCILFSVCLIPILGREVTTSIRDRHK